MPSLVPVICVKFDIFLPVSYIDRKTGNPRNFRPSDIRERLEKLTQKYAKWGGYTISNPHAPPPYAGVYQSDSEERSHFLSFIIPDHLVNEATADVLELVSFLQHKCNQQEILTLSYSVTRFVPSNLLREPPAPSSSPHPAA